MTSYSHSGPFSTDISRCSPPPRRPCACPRITSSNTRVQASGFAARELPSGDIMLAFQRVLSTTHFKRCRILTIVTAYGAFLGVPLLRCRCSSPQNRNKNLHQDPATGVVVFANIIVPAERSLVVLVVVPRFIPTARGTPRPCNPRLYRSIVLHYWKHSHDAPSHSLCCSFG